ncbi:MAG: alpha/beta fold hydrolase [Marivibrio sp.]|uniref:alpha/beta hydrolase family protein n=1 Tax=Marivibrio sp. TaxID=2039719 RepID=UPI0032EB9FAB
MEPRLNGALALLALLLIGLSVWRLEAQEAPLAVAPFTVDATPAILYRPAEGAAGPPVLIAHGFAGSQQLMQPIAIALARAGFTAVTFDYLGHGRHPRPLTGDVTAEDGAGARLQGQMEAVAAAAIARARAAGWDGERLAVLGHSMASDIVVRYAQAHANVAAVVAVSMFSPAVTADSPRNLLIVDGALETRLLEEGRRAIAKGAGLAPEAVEIERTYGSIEDGDARRLVAADAVEHVGVLYSQETQRETIAWLDQVFDRTVNPREAAPVNRGLWIALLLLGTVLLARPLASRLPALGGEPLGANLSWRQFLPAALAPAIATPLILSVTPTDFLPVLVGDYMALHFGLYGLIAAAGLYWLRRRRTEPQPVRPIPSVTLLAVSIAAAAYAVAAIGLPADLYIFNFQPTALRGPLIAAMIVGALIFYLADEWLTRGGDAPRGAYWITKLLFLLSLGLAVALDPSELFFLLILTPVIIPVFAIYGLFSRWAYLRTRHPIPGGVAAAVAVGWAIGAVFPVLGG